MNVEEKIQNQISNNKVIIYIKGTPCVPMCGFSFKIIEIMRLLKAEFAYVNVLENPDIRKILPIISNWPTFPQLYVNGVLIGGFDIVEKLYKENEMKKIFLDVNSLSSISFKYWEV